MAKIQVSNDDGVMLVKHARLFVTDFIKNSKTTLQDIEFEKRFSCLCGVFVTLNKHDSLRGCIGYPLPHKKLSDTLKESAIAAATDDPRFPAVNSKELDEIVFEVTVLTAPQMIRVADPRQYPNEIKVGRDGLIIEKGSRAGLLLPQVPIEYNWNPIQFLEHTCQKAGLQKDCWRDSDVKIQKFEGAVFAETIPHGKIIKREL